VGDLVWNLEKIVRFQFKHFLHMNKTIFRCFVQKNPPDLLIFKVHHSQNSVFLNTSCSLFKDTTYGKFAVTFGILFKYPKEQWIELHTIMWNVEFFPSIPQKFSWNHETIHAMEGVRCESTVSSQCSAIWKTLNISL
jgi:hypothetical protein